MPQGICNSCGAVHYGWALAQDEQRKCECGGHIEVRDLVIEKELDDLKAMREVRIK